jgi:hypothetical protein
MNRALAVFTILLLSVAAFNSIPSVTCQTEKSGDLTLSGNESLLITDRDYTVNGSITIKENASLKLVNTHLDFTQGNWVFQLSGTGHLELINSNINMTIPNSITAHDNASIKMQDSEVFKKFWCDIHLRYHYTYGFELKDQSCLIADNSKIGTLSSGGSTTNVENSFIGYLTQDSADLQLRNTTIDSVMFNLRNGNYSCKLNLGENIKHWSSVLDGGGLPWNMTLDDVRSQIYSIYAENCTLRVIDSNPYFIYCRGESLVSLEDTVTPRLYLLGNASVEISNSSIQSLDGTSARIQRIAVKDSRIDVAEFTLDGEASIEGSSIGGWDSGFFHSDTTGGVRVNDSVFDNFTIASNTVYELDNVTVYKRAWMQYSFNPLECIHLSGDLKYHGKLQAFDPYSVESIYYRLSREFEVRILRGGEPLESASVELRRGNETLWRGTSDARGVARFNLTFSRVLVVNPVPGQVPLVDTNNMTSALSLVVMDGGDTWSMSAGVFVDTPLLVTFESFSASQRVWIASSFVFVLLLSVFVLCFRLFRWRLK